MKNYGNLIVVALFAIMPYMVCAQDPIPVEILTGPRTQESAVGIKTSLDLPSIFEERYYRSESVPEFKWLPDTRSYSYIKEDADASQCIMRVDIKSGKETVLADSDLFVYNGKRIFVEDYSFTPDLKTVMLFTNSRRVWRYNTRGDFYLLDIASGRMMKVAPDADPSQVQFAKLSPDGTKVAYVYRHDVYVQDVATGKVSRYTNDGTEFVINGTFDWAYEEEFSCRDGLRWSPDSRKLAFWKIDSSETGVFYMINYTDSIYSRPIPIPYPKVGTAMSSAYIGVIHVDEGNIVWMDIAGEPNENYLPYMDWAYNSRELIIEQIPRVQTKNNIILADVYDGSSRTIYTDDTHGKYWIDVNDNVEWINDGKEFLWLSEEDGWRHLYAISRDGKNKRKITEGEYDILSVNSYDPVKGYVYFTSSLDSPVTRMDYRVSVNGNGKAEPLDPNQTSGTHSYNVAYGSRYALHTYSSAGVPMTADLIDLRNNNVIRTVVANTTLKERINALNLPKQEFFKVNIGGGVELDAWMIKPRDFDPSGKYPVIFHVYGEPVGLTVTDAWGADNYLFHQYLAQNGFVVISVENRGTPSPRGVEFRKYCYKAIGVNAPKDQAAAVEAILSENNWLDSERVGVWGWSGGGSMTLNALLKYPDLYQVGVSVAPVPDQRLYDSFYQERFMLTPEMNPEGFYNGSPVNFAAGLKGKLLLIHGTGDDNCHYQGAERMINELILHKKQFNMFAYPNRSHGIYEGKNTSIHLRTMMFEFFMENLR